MRTSIRYYIAGLLLLLSQQAMAIEYNQVKLDEHSLNFGFTIMGVPLSGNFGKLSGQISFDPANLAKAQARLDINVASIDTGSDDGNKEVVEKKWFNVKDYPTASFVSTSLKPLGGNRYQASGKLTLKGRTLDVSTPVTFQTDGTRATFAGAFTIKRIDYAIGEGEWTDVSTVANEVRITFNIVVNAAPASK